MKDKESFGAELAKQLPVKEIYNDVAHPTLSTVGKTLQGATRVALAPISAMIWGYDKIAGYLDVAIPEYFEKRKIEKDKIVSPDPAVAVPLVEAMRYTSHKPELKEMFTNLLGASMNSDVIDEHPSFVDIIKQLSSDECKMLRYLYTVEVMPMLKIRLQLTGQKGEINVTPYFSDICYKAGCQYPQKFPEYLDNLHRLGLVEVYYERYLTDDSFYLDLKQHDGFLYPASDERGSFTDSKGMYELSEFGNKFCGVCLE